MARGADGVPIRGLLLVPEPVPDQAAGPTPGVVSDRG